ncbi:Phytochelatin synthase [Shewanella psychrophila]|uniref:glutathione gamma-glutamylcysteinyltransferase n=1 Tax=Shewanella psychrophila TaxID=225848 RepID=A0A1S6HJG3_9GAMM|nr:phytochelatin synthase family protein [Shewanella psychrophila]AQS35667.1 Phytochelatin synthase [Shewanella psychrophila]
MKPQAMNTTIRRCLITLLCFSIFYLLTHAPAFASPLVHWNSNEGIHRLEESAVKGDFFALATHFEGQQNKVYCGVASMTVILNALRVGKGEHKITPDESIIAPQDRGYFPQKNWSPLFERYTQNTVVELSPKTRLEIMGKPRQEKGTEKEQASDYGLGLADLAGLAKNHGLRAHAYFVKDSATYTEQKASLIHALVSQDTYAIVNYSRSVLDQAGSGHFSPVVAYHKASDSFLIMDVSNTFQTWVWVDANKLFEAMAIKDNGNSRGFLVISET